MAKWWSKGDIRPEVGHRFTLDMGKWGLQPCEVLVAEPPHRLACSFADWRLVWTLTAQDGGTLLRLDHEGLDRSKPQHQIAWDVMGAGWRTALLPRLAKLVEG